MSQHGSGRSRTVRPLHRESARRFGLPQPLRPGEQPVVHRAHTSRRRARSAKGESGHLRHVGERTCLGPRQHRRDPRWRGAPRSSAQLRRAASESVADSSSDTLSRVSTENCCSSCDVASSPTADSATKPGTTVLTRTAANGPSKARPLCIWTSPLWRTRGQPRQTWCSFKRHISAGSRAEE